MGIQPSASKTALLLACVRPFDPALEIALDDEEAPEAPRYGSAFHEIITTPIIASGFDKAQAKAFFESDAYTLAVDAAGESWNVKRHTSELAGHVKSSFGVLRNWAEAERFTKKDGAVIHVETSYAIPVVGRSKASRRIAAPTVEGHKYVGVSHTTEIAGTVDLDIEVRDISIRLDHKTGTVDHGFAEPTKMPQMKTLGLTARTDAKSLVLGALHADRRGLPVIYSDSISPRELEPHRKALAVAFSRIGDGSLRPTDECKYCPAKIGCPAHTAELLSTTTAAIVEAAGNVLTTPRTPAISAAVRAGKLYILARKMRPLLEEVRKEIKNMVDRGEIIEIPGEGVLTARPEEYENLSKASILRALGAVEGEKLLKTLRKKGVIEKSKRHKVVPVP